MDSRRSFAESIVKAFPASNARAVADSGVAVFTPENHACRVAVAYEPEHELVRFLLGTDEIPVELSLTGPVVFEDVRRWIAPRVEAVFAGRYEQRWTTLSDGSLVSVVGTFHFDEGDVHHVYRRRLGWLRRKRRRRVTFAPYE